MSQRFRAGRSEFCNFSAGSPIPESSLRILSACIPASPFPNSPLRYTPRTSRNSSQAARALVFAERILRAPQMLPCSASAAMTETGTLVISDAPGALRNKKDPGWDASRAKPRGTASCSSTRSSPRQSLCRISVLRSSRRARTLLPFWMYSL